VKFLLKNGHALELSGANCHAKLRHLKQLLGSTYHIYWDWVQIQWFVHC